MPCGAMPCGCWPLQVPSSVSGLAAWLRCCWPFPENAQPSCCRPLAGAYVSLRCRRSNCRGRWAGRNWLSPSLRSSTQNSRHASSGIDKLALARARTSACRSCRRVGEYSARLWASNQTTRLMYSCRLAVERYHSDWFEHQRLMSAWIASFGEVPEPNKVSLDGCRRCRWRTLLKYHCMRLGDVEL